MTEYSSATIDMLSARAPELAAQLQEVAYQVLRPRAPARFLTITGPRKASREAAGIVTAQVLHEIGLFVTPNRAQFGAAELIGHPFSDACSPPGVALLRNWDSATAGLVVIDAVEPLIASGDSSLAAGQIIGAIAVAGERTAGPVICLSDTADAIERLLASEPALRSRFQHRINCAT